eukprot:TRINITY_DN3443_c0_g1_i2.p1 TRINITY_DN3443_c0_g1~~TRINITY_DN3443_c0_g1_i2.p1  ORF type:complete len:217 (-),score=34.18 TRINITY_DN3443_c0_g1_i2:355-1005(-)
MTTSTTTTVKEAIRNWEVGETERRRKEAAAEGRDYDGTVVAAEEPVVRLIGNLPPIVKLDKDIFTLRKVRHLGLSTNSIEKVFPGMAVLENLEVLSLSRNNIKKLENLDIPHLKELWLSYNRIERLAGIERLRSLHTLYLGNNLISSYLEVERYLTQLPALTDLLLINNPLERSLDKHDYRIGMVMRLPQLQRLDGKGVEPEEREEAHALRAQTAS